MSKCREVYVAHCANDEQFHTPYDWWQAAWNAAIARAAEICNEIAKDGEGLAGEVWAERCAIGIAKEIERD